MISRALNTNQANQMLASHFFVFVRFGIIGVTAGAIYLLVMWGADLLLSFKRIEVVSIASLFPKVVSVVDMFPSSGVSDLVLNFNFRYIAIVSVAYIAATVFHYLANRHFTFGAVKGRHQQQIIRYLIMWAINYLLVIIIVGVCVEQFQFSPYIGTCISIPFTMTVNYILATYWVFRV